MLVHLFLLKIIIMNHTYIYIKVTVMKMLFSRHDADKSGEIEINEVVDIFAENGLTFDEDELEVIFHKFDVDKSGTLDFTEFTEMMSDLNAEKAIVEKRGANYELPPSLAEHFTSEQMAELKVHFGMFDADGGGSIAASELKAVLDDLGLNPTDEQVREVIVEVDRDRSGEIEFVEFAELMHKVNTGDIALGVLAQVVLDSAAGQRLSKEVAELLEAKQIQEAKYDEEEEREELKQSKKGNKEGEDEEEDGDEEKEDEINPLYVNGLISIDIDKKEATKCHVLLEGPDDTPYENRALSIEIKVGDDYPFAPPFVKFTHRLLHVNFSMSLDGTTSMPQLLQYWDAEWDLAKLLNYIMELLVEPNLSLLPSDYADGTRHDQKTSSFVSHHEEGSSYDQNDSSYDWNDDHEGVQYGGEQYINHQHHNHNEEEDDKEKGGVDKQEGGSSYDDNGSYHHEGNDDDGSSYYESMHIVQGSPAVDLRRKKGQNRFLAEAVYLFCEQRDKYDAIAKDFATKYAHDLPRGYF
mmetsp:Transcript_16136/g.20893  ORF Transcript_16136/g.20893 Transcript_16136/m.20893 type:complete len:523 (+) Transcript_16136:600-2168(+)